MSKIRVFDNGGETYDRYTVVYLATFDCGQYLYVGMSENPFHPLGFGQHGELPASYLHDCPDKEITLSDLPPDCQTLVEQDLAEIEGYGS